MTETKTPLHLFDAYGVELEYMIADQRSLDVLPVADWLIEAECGRVESEIEVGDLAWSNELVLHVVELKTAAPTGSLVGLADVFQAQVNRVNDRLKTIDGGLMPSAMHPWMDADREMKLWPHEYGLVYKTFHRIFNCRGHGWANLQSVHLNLPFQGDDEFGRLHAAVRLVLPLLPGIAASSPVIDGQLTGLLDSRLEVYRSNSRRIPSVAGRVIPERAFTRADYDRLVFEPMFADIAPLDPDGVLRDEFLNARGAIARFGRGSIEIRVIDIQECPAADLAVLQATVGVLKQLVNETWSSVSAQQAVEIDPLYDILTATIRDADQAVIDNPEFLRHFGYTAASSCTIAELWRYLVDHTSPETDAATGPALTTILKHGPLARRLVNHLRGDVLHERLYRTYEKLGQCLSEGRMFLGESSSA